MQDVISSGVSVTVILLGILFGILFNQKGLDKLVCGSTNSTTS